VPAARRHTLEVQVDKSMGITALFTSWRSRTSKC
jgi:hypothetical protein